MVAEDRENLNATEEDFFVDDNQLRPGSKLKSFVIFSLQSDCGKRELGRPTNEKALTNFVKVAMGFFTLFTTLLSKVA